MNLKEYEQIKDYGYEQYCDYLVNKHGAATGPYFTDTYWTKSKKPKQPVANKNVTRTKEGLFLHHRQENHVASLSNPQVAAEHDFELQSAENLVPCDYLEHLLLHILICENPEPFEGEYVGANGTLTWILPALVGYYEKRHISQEWQIPAFNRIENDKDVYDTLIERFIHSDKIQENCEVTEEELRNLVSDRLVFSHNEIVMQQLEDYLSKDTKALVDLGTGLGKTTTALQYAIDHHCNCLVLSPSNIIKDGWNKAAITLANRAGCKLEVMGYQAFTNNYLTMDLSKYDLIICDEAHHCRGPQWGKGLRYVIDNKLIRVIGLTATPADVGESIFGGNICKGLTVTDGIEQGIIHPISYVGAYYSTDDIWEEVGEFEDQELLGQLNLAINNTPTVKEIILSNMPAGPRKCIIFTQSIQAMDQAIDILKDIYPNSEYRKIHSKMDPIEVEENKHWFEEATEGFLCAVNMISEGAHYRGVNTVFMFRKTKSELLFNQQIGRIITLSKYENPHSILFDLVNNANSVEVSKPLKLSIGKRKKTLEQEQNFEESEQIIIKDYTTEIVEILNKINLKKKKRIYWTEEEDKILYANYAQLGPKGCASLINRTLQSIQDRARHLKLRFEELWWSEEEINILKQNYSNKTWQEMLVLLPKRSRGVIAKKAEELSLKSGYNLPWSEEEIRLVEEYYLSDFNELLQLLPNRSENAITTQARKLRIFKPHDYTKEEDDIIIKYYPIEGADIIKRLPNRSEGSIKQRASRLGVQSQKSRKNVNGKKTFAYDKDTGNFVKEYGSSQEAMRELSGRNGDTIGACCRKRNKIAFNFYWSYIKADNYFDIK